MKTQQNKYRKKLNSFRTLVEVKTFGKKQFL